MEESKQEGWEEESTCCMGTITLAQLRCDGVDLYKMWLYDAIASSCDVSTSDHEDFTWFGCESTWARLYGTAMIFLLET